MKINYKKLIVIIIITMLIGSFFSFFTGNDIYNEIVKPPLSPPGLVFPIVWFILYTLMGISFYIVLETDSVERDIACLLYIIQLVFNSFWTLIFFGFNNFLLSFIWLLVLIGLVIFMIIKFYKVNKTAGLLQIPYLLWLIFALYLNFSIYLLNK